MAASRRRWWVLAAGLVLALVVVGTLALRPRGPAGPPAPTAEERALVEALRDRLNEQWADHPLPLDQARAEAKTEERAGRSAIALDRLCAAAVSGDLDSELSLAIQALRSPVPDRVRVDEARALVVELAHDSPKGALVPAALGWAAVSRSDPQGALLALQADPGTLEGHEARLRALSMLGQDASVEAAAILKLAPDHDEACEVVARHELAQGDLSAVRATVGACTKAGAGGPILPRLLGQAADAAGRYEEARDAYTRSGANLHAAAIISQEGLPDPQGEVASAIADQAPPAALQGVWVNLIRGDLPAATAAARRLDGSGMPGPEAAIAVAAGLLAAGDAEGARAKVAGFQSAEALTLLARADAVLGDDDAAERAFAAAVAAQPWNLDLHRERLAFLATRRKGAVPEAVRAVVALDPVTLGLVRAWRHRDAPWVALAPSAWPVLPERDVSGLLLACVVDPVGVDERALAALTPADRGHALLHLAWARAATDPTAGRALAAEALAALPGDPGARAVGAELALEAGDTGAAEALLGPAPGPAPISPVADEAASGSEPAALAWARARLLVAKGDAAGARAVLLDAAGANPEHTGLWASILSLDETGTIPAPGSDRLTAGLGSTR